jgi:hypothetical protein
MTSLYHEYMRSRQISDTCVRILPSMRHELTHDERVDQLQYDMELLTQLYRGRNIIADLRILVPLQNIACT